MFNPLFVLIYYSIEAIKKKYFQYLDIKLVNNKSNKIVLLIKLQFHKTNVK